MTPRQLIEPARLAGNALLHTQSDARLVDLARAGNERAFEVIVGRYRSSLLRYCERLLPPGRAEDAVQQAFLNAYRAIDRNEAELNLKPWLYRVAHNASLNLLRQNGWNYDEIPENFDGVIQPPQALEQRERIHEVFRAVQDLPERQRDAMILRELEGRSYEEIGAALGVTDGAVRQLLNRARGTLRATATALTPPRLLESFFDKASSPSTAQIAELSAGAGGAAGVVKLGAALVVAGAVGGAVVAGPAHHLVLGGPTAGDRGSAALAATDSRGGAGRGTGGYSSLGGATALGIGTGPVQGHGEGATGGTGQTGATGTTSATGPSGQRGPGGGGSGSRGGSGAGGSGFVDFNPNSGDGNGGGDHGGSGSGSGDGGHSGSGDGGGSGGGDHGGSGSGDGGHSGSGGGGSDGGSSGSGSSGPDGGGSSGSGETSSGLGGGLPSVGSSGPGTGTTSGSGSGSGSSGDGGGGGDMSSSGSGDGGDGIDHSGPGG